MALRSKRLDFITTEPDHGTRSLTEKAERIDRDRLRDREIDVALQW